MTDTDKFQKGKSITPSPQGGSGRLHRGGMPRQVTGSGNSKSENGVGGTAWCVC